jgi:hypothetical protein
VQDLVSRNQSAERLISAIHGRGVGAWRPGMLLPLALVRGEPFTLRTYHDYMKFHATQVSQALLAPSRRAGAVPAGVAQRARAVSAQADQSQSQAEAPSMRAPIEFPIADFPPPPPAAAAAAAVTIDQEDTSALETMMELNASMPPPRGQLPQLESDANDFDQVVPATPVEEYD